jgi:hypothetical protein
MYIYYFFHLLFFPVVSKLILDNAYIFICLFLFLVDVFKDWRQQTKRKKEEDMNLSMNHVAATANLDII